MSATKNWNEMISFIWSVKEVLRDTYKRHQYGEIILPMVVLRRLDATLAEPSSNGALSRKGAVLRRASELQAPYDTHSDLLCHVAELEFYNTSKYDFTNLLGDEDAVLENFQDYLQGYSQNVREIIQAFDFHNEVEKLGRAGILFDVVGRFASDKVDVSPTKVSNLDMGYIYEELIRGVADLSNEEAGEHFTPREVIELMVDLLVADAAQLHVAGRVVTVYDPTCGTGGMLTVAEAKLDQMNAGLRVHLRGQEVQEESFATCKSDMLIKNETTAQIRCGDTLKNDLFPGEYFDYVIANPPYGKDWKTAAREVRREHEELGMSGRFGPGLPSTTDGQMLFVLHMLSKLKPKEQGGGRLAVVTNESPLFNGDAGSGPSNIRRHLFENDLVEAVVALPTELFYNTGIATYVWIISNDKAPERAGYVQLLDARELFAKMDKSLGKKRNRLTPDHIREIVSDYESFVQSERSRIFLNEDFGYRQVVVEQPLRVSYQLNETVLTGLVECNAVQRLGDRLAETLMEQARSKAPWRSTSKSDVQQLVDFLTAPVERPTAALKNAIVKVMTTRDPEGEIATTARGESLPDAQLRSKERLPLSDDVEEFLATEVVPFVDDGWVNRSLDKTGYEVPLSEVFFKYVPLRRLDAIDNDLKESRDRIMALIAEVAQ